MGGVGLLTKEALPYLAEVFKDFENRWNPNYKPAVPDIPFPNKPSANDPLYREELGRVCDLLLRHEVGAYCSKRMLSRLAIRIKAIGVWDTVGKVLTRPKAFE